MLNRSKNRTVRMRAQNVQMVDANVVERKLNPGSSSEYHWEVNIYNI